MVDWGFSWSVVFTGLVVVFIVLVLLVLLCAIMGKVFSAIDKSKKNKASSAPAAAPVVKPQGNSAVIEMVQDGIADDVVAAITAAIAVLMSEDGVKRPFAVRSIKKSRDTRNAWNVAGIQDNTRPF